jgi:tetratricopeptide (TPR) repeat protein/predicted Ser/Thr protein kinase
VPPVDAPTNANLLPSEEPEAALVGTEIGPYRVERVLGAGGMGAVYLAEQTRPIRRRVALKVVRLGLETRSVLARFEAERQSLALMNHPGIAKVLDAGSTAAGRPYFVMEYVAGLPLTDYCDENRLGTRDRLDLFAEVCGAVQHAHQKGIIHRDLKPTNVLVTEEDGRVQPKVIDFGIAKATRGRLTDLTVVTQYGVPMGTPEYMSPEQAEMKEADVDTTTDIYSLGVVLYELLTGTLPYDREELRSAGITGLARILRDTEPRRPSTRMGGDPASATAAERRLTDAATLRRQLSGDLDWIVLKAMEKDRARRYPSASELAADVRRYMRQEPVAAGPPSAGYRLGKFVSRHRKAVALVSMLALALAVGAAGTLVGLLRARRAESEAQAQRALAEAEARKAKAVSQFLQDMLGAADPHRQGRWVRVVDVLSRAVEKIPASYAGDPALEAAVRDTIGSTFMSLGDLEAAEGQIKKALEVRTATLGPEHPDTLLSQHHLVEWLQKKGRPQEGVELGRRTLALRERVLGRDHPDTLVTLNDLAVGLFQSGKPDEGIAAMTDCVERRRRVLGEGHQKTLLSSGNLASMLQGANRLDEAEALFRRLLAEEERALGPEHPTTLFAVKGLAGLLHDRERLDEAEALYRRAHEASRRVSGPRTADSLITANDYALLLLDRGRAREAEALLADTVREGAAGLGKDHRFVAMFRRNHGKSLLSLRRYAEAEGELLAAHAGLLREFGAPHRETQAAVRRLAELYESWGRPGDAASWKARLTPAS